MKLKLKKDFIIPEGTIFENVDGMTREFVSGNYEAMISLHKDSVIYIDLEMETEDKTQEFNDTFEIIQDE